MGVAHSYCMLIDTNHDHELACGLNITMEQPMG